MSDQPQISEGNSAKSARRFGRPFVKGASGNPGGRPKRQLNLEALAKSHTEAAVLALVGALRAPRIADRITAANSLLDRGWGRPAQMILGDPSRPVQIDFRWADDTAVQPGAQPQPAKMVEQLVLDAVEWSDVAPAPGEDGSK